MAGLLSGDPSHLGMSETGSCSDRLDERDRYGSNWYFSRRDIEENSPSRKDGIDLKKEAYFRKSYCTFLQDLGMRLKVPQVTIATAIIFCHRFFLRQSHLKNDRRTVATVCMFLAGKVEETPRPLKDVILVSYEIIHKKDPSAVQRIKQKEVYEQQKELILLGERAVLATLGFDLNVHHPYKPLVDSIKKFMVAQNALAQVAWNFVNDGLRTSLCLQFKPHHIAAGAIFLAAKFLKVKLPSDGEKVWWQEFDVTPRQLEEVSNQMLELYEQNRIAPPPSHGSELDGSGGGANNNNQAPAKTAAATEEQPTSSLSGYSSQTVVNKPGGNPVARQSNQSEAQRNSIQNPNEGHRMIETKAVGVRDGKEWDSASKENHHSEKSEEDGEVNEDRTPLEAKEEKPTDGGQNESSVLRVGIRGSTDAIKKIDKEKVKAALEKRRRNRSEDVVRKPDLMDDYDIIERELENGVEMAELERKQQKSDTPSKMHSATRAEANHNHGDVGEKSVDWGERPQSEAVDTESNAEEGELSSLDIPAMPREYHSPKSSSRKRKGDMSPLSRDGRSDYFHERDHHPRNYRQEPRRV